jgi:hypothetical protein
VALGIVKAIEGKVEVLRNPTNQATDDWKKTVEQRGHTIARFNARYWESHQVKTGSKIYYGDQISTGPQSRLVVLLDDQIELGLGAETSTHLTRGYIKDQSSGLTERWVSLISGVIRAKVEGAKAERPTQFRTRSIAMGVRGTEFILSSRQGRSELATLEGVVQARRVSEQEHIMFEKWAQSGPADPKSEADRNNLQELAELSAKEQQVALPAGKKIELVEPTGAADATGFALVQQPSSPKQLVVRDLNATDQDRLNQIKSQFDAQPSAQPTRSEVSTAETAVPAKQFERHHILGLSAAFSSIDIKLADKSTTSLNGVGPGIEYRWSFHEFMDIGAFWLPNLGLRGEVGRLFSDDERTKFKSDIGLGGLRLGASYPWRRFRVGAALNILGISNFYFEVLASGVRSGRELNTEISPVINLAAAYQHDSGYGMLFELGASKLKFVEPYPTGLSIDTSVEHSISFIRLGVFRKFGG